MFLHLIIRYDKAHVVQNACQKKYPLKNFANFSRTIERYDIKFYTLVIDSVITTRPYA